MVLHVVSVLLVFEHRVDIQPDVSALLAEHSERHVELYPVHDHVLVHAQIGHTQHEALVAAETVLGPADACETVLVAFDAAA